MEKPAVPADNMFARRDQCIAGAHELITFMDKNGWTCNSVKTRGGETKVAIG